METLLPRLVHVSVDRRLIIVLLDELDHEITQVAEGVRHIGFGGGPAVDERVGSMMGSDGERPRSEKLVPFANRRFEIGHEIRVLEEGSITRHQ
jgi:hypothetical protein